MLLPSFDTDESFHHLGSLVSPPTSPPTSHSSPTISSIFSTCRALQSMLSAPTQLPSPANSPPLLNTPAPITSNHKFRLSRSLRKVVGDHQPRMKMKVTKRQAVVPRGLNKRRRDSSDDGERFHLTNVDNSAQDVKGGGDSEGEERNILDCPSTPKRSRIAPESLPFGLQRSDFHDVHMKSMPASIDRPSSQQSVYPFNPPSSSAFTFSVPFHSSPPPMPNSTISNSFLTTAKGSIVSSSPLANLFVTSSQNSTIDSQALITTTDNGPEDNEWSEEDDKILVEVILEKLKISKADLEDCARSLGRDRHSVGRRWKSLVTAGEIGLKNGSGSGSKRSQIYGSWR